MEKHRILIVEDNPDTRRFLEAMLSKEFDIITAENGVVGIDYARNKSPDLIIMDVMLPILSGFDACSLLKKDERTKRIPIIFLSAKNTVGDITTGLTTGADDYISKPFDFKELLVRIQTRLRLSKEDTSQPLQAGELVIHPATREVLYGNKKIDLTLTEFDLLRFLVQRAGTPVSRDDILREIWREGSAHTNHRTIDVHVRALRKKIPALSKMLSSIYGVGYQFQKP